VARRRRRKKYLPTVAVAYNSKPDARVEMLKSIAPKMLENPVSATVDMNSLTTINPMASVMMTGRMR